ncbi:MAG: translation elongation factor Ts [Bacteroidia bacterium]|nr:translation elongation factor Ts [Bacteroidia bacterium]
MAVVINAADVAKLRRVTLAGMMHCKKALEEAEGNFDKAIEIIRKKGQAVANKRADKEATEGVVLSKVTADSKMGAIIVLNSETDFVAKNADFIGLANKVLDVAIANKPANLEALKALPLEGGKVGENPVAVDKDSVPEKVIAQEIEIGKEQARRDGKPEDMLEKIAQGKLTKFFKESTLLNQDFVKDNKMTIRQYLQSVNKELTVTDFKRFTLNL